MTIPRKSSHPTWRLHYSVWQLFQWQWLWQLLCLEWQADTQWDTLLTPLNFETNKSVDMFINKSEITSNKLQVIYKCINQRNYLSSHHIQGRGQRELLFQLRDENENFFYSISHIETRREFFDTWSQASRLDREKFFFNLGHRDKIEIYYLNSQASRREREFSWSH